MTTTMHLQKVASCLEALGNETRLSIFRLLVPYGPTGLSVGDIQRELGVPGSTLSHHLSRLVWEGLVRQERQGRSLMCIADFESMDGIIAFMTKECCVLADPADVGTRKKTPEPA